jgi:YVTN family beta-propeller protein
MEVGENPDFIATYQDKAWIIDDHQNRILKISSDNKAPLLTIPVPNACTAPIVGFNAVWVMSCSEEKLYKIDLLNGRILAKISTGIADKNGEMSLAIGDGSVWLLSDSTGTLSRINPETNSVQKRITVKSYSYCAAFGHNSIWVTNYLNNSVQRINTKTNSVIATIPVGVRPRFLTTGEHGVWILNQGDGTVSKIDPSLNKVTASIEAKAVGGGGDITAGSGKVWVISTNNERPVQIINQLTDKIETIYLQKPPNEKTFKVDGAVRLSENFVWISGYYSKTIWVLKKKFD